MPKKTTAKKSVKKEAKVEAKTNLEFQDFVKQLKEKSEADKIWDEIKNRPIMMFGLPNQFVFQHCTMVTVEPSKLYVTMRSSAALPSLEAAVAPDFEVELNDKFAVVKRVTKSLVKK